MKNEESVLAWLSHQVESDEIEDVTDEMLDMLIEKSPNLAAFFCTFFFLFLDKNYFRIRPWLLLTGTFRCVRCRFLFFLFFVKSLDDKNNNKHMAVLKELENIDDECDAHQIAFVKISNLDEAKEYGLDNLPALVYFENRIPSVYEGEYYFNFKTALLLNKANLDIDYFILIDSILNKST